MEGGVWFDSDSVHDSLYISCTSSRVSPVLLAALLRTLSHMLSADFACVHLHYEDEEEYLRRYAALYPMCIGPSTHDLKRSIPDLPWATVFGPPYTALFSPARLALCPAYISEQLPNDSWFLQITPDPLLARTQPQQYERARDSAKEHLGTEHFLNLASPRASRMAPRFEWAPVIRNPLLEYLHQNNLLNE